VGGKNDLYATLKTLWALAQSDHYKSLKNFCNAIKVHLKNEFFRQRTFVALRQRLEPSLCTIPSGCSILRCPRLFEQDQLIVNDRAIVILTIHNLWRPIRCCEFSKASYSFMQRLLARINHRDDAINGQLNISSGWLVKKLQFFKRATTPSSRITRLTPFSTFEQTKKCTFLERILGTFILYFG